MPQPDGIRGATMYLLQSLIIFAVVGSNIHWQWTPNGYLAAGLGGLLAYAVTWWIVEIQDRFARFGLEQASDLPWPLKFQFAWRLHSPHVSVGIIGRLLLFE
jgi:hypothetical protein